MFRTVFTFAVLCCVPALASPAHVRLDVDLAHPTLKAGEEQPATTYLKVELTGHAPPTSGDRAPVNVALVIDKSGSMQGDKIAHAREAAIAAVDRLRDSDIVSVVVYDSTCQVLVPATKASDRAMIKQKISSIGAGGNTALFAGVSKAAAEVRKFLEKNQVNRVILLSDGLANVGPSSPGELESLGRSLVKEGITVTSMGLGADYNEDLMTSLAAAGGGNHVFIESADSLVAVMSTELDSVLSVVAKNFEIQVKLAEGVRPVRLLSGDGTIQGQNVTLRLPQLYGEQSRFFLLEIEVPSGADSTARDVAEVTAAFRNMIAESSQELSAKTRVGYSQDEQRLAADRNDDIVARAVLLIANEANKRATNLRDAGQIQEARELLINNASFLKKNAVELGSTELDLSCENNLRQADLLDEKNWNFNRKRMVEQQFVEENQQTYDGARGSRSFSFELKSPKGSK